MSSEALSSTPDALSQGSIDALVHFIHAHYNHAYQQGFVPLHTPCFDHLEKQLLNNCIDSTFVSSVGAYVEQFEQELAEFTDAKHAVAVVNGTMGLFLGLKVVGVEEQDLVITQSLSFVATANAIKMLNANPLFLDVSKQTLGLSAEALNDFLVNETFQKDNQCFHSKTGRRISACVPMHTLGFSVEIEKIVALCHQYNVKVVEDAAESLGSYANNQHTGTFGDVGVFSFNGNKVITTGGGGMLVTNSDEFAKRAKHLSTTAKIPHAWLFEHDEIAYNLRMPNLNAALGVAQMAKLPEFLTEKAQLAKKYQLLINDLPGLVNLESPSSNSNPNYWLIGLLCEDHKQRDELLKQLNEQSIQARPLWTPMHQLDIYKNEQAYAMPNTEWVAQRLVNLPSGVLCHKAGAL